MVLASLLQVENLLADKYSILHMLQSWQSDNI